MPYSFLVHQFSLLLDISSGIQKLLCFVSQVYPKSSPIIARKGVLIHGKVVRKQDQIQQANLNCNRAPD
jgi:hypothetical protein